MKNKPASERWKREDKKPDIERYVKTVGEKTYSVTAYQKSSGGWMFHPLKSGQRPCKIKGAVTSLQAKTKASKLIKAEGTVAKKA